MDGPPNRWYRLLATAAGAIALGTDLLYLILLTRQDEAGAGAGRVSLVAITIALAGAAAIAAPLAASRGQTIALLAVASFVLLLWGVIALLSIGMFLIIAGMAAVAALGMVLFTGDRA